MTVLFCGPLQNLFRSKKVAQMKDFRERRRSINGGGNGGLHIGKVGSASSLSAGKELQEVSSLPIGPADTSPEGVGDEGRHQRIVQKHAKC